MTLQVSLKARNHQTGTFATQINKLLGVNTEFFASFTTEMQLDKTVCDVFISPLLASPTRLHNTEPQSLFTIWPILQ